ncbi:NlpC/P60 family protein [Streptantibioticus rubrisoli]|uniref:NlpC/P60 family protein n=1 Tax=Streptantibioticus rubrisoli TaxID=1387313 RepID=A0ABT1PJJ3_9ACTN|nr:NlpC/P60 family protein [Streptantibioticus rubrisoli]MCQ4045535.1 NlpC/P60 family protein [Streptantibioticus rubrisoli]
MASHRKPRRRALTGATARTAATFVIAGAGAASALTDTGHAAPKPAPEHVSSQVDALFQQAEQATQKYDAAKALADAERGELSSLQDELARRTQQINRTRDRLGTVAAAQYRSGDPDPAMRLLLSSRPDQYLEQAGMLQRIGRSQAATLGGLTTQERQAQALRDQAARKLSTLQATEHQLAASKQTVASELDHARDLLGQLAPGQPATSQSATAPPATAQPHSPTHYATAPEVSPPNSRAAQAVSFARAQLGKPYVWGATGPNSYDCSGLTQAAWSAAGVSLPRTTYSQINAGTHVPQGQLQPGDLVFFYSSVSHVGIYIGGGQMIHAPHPGAPVRISPISEMPFAGATRPG